MPKTGDSAIPHGATRWCPLLSGGACSKAMWPLDGERGQGSSGRAQTRWSPAGLGPDPERTRFGATSAHAMNHPIPRLSVPAALALGSAALGAAFATGLFLGEQGWDRGLRLAPLGGQVDAEGERRAEPARLHGRLRIALIPSALGAPGPELAAPLLSGRETVVPMAPPATAAPAAPRGQSPVAVSAEPLHAGAPGAAEPPAGQQRLGRHPRG